MVPEFIKWVHYLSDAIIDSGEEATLRDTGWVPWGREDPPPMEGMTTHSGILVWRIPWAKEPGGYSPWDRRVRKDWRD